MDISKYQVKDNLKTVDKFLTDILNNIHPNKSLSKEVKLLLNKYVQRVVQHYNEHFDEDNEKYCNTYIRGNLAKHGFSEMIRKSALSNNNPLNIEVNDECKYLIEYIMEEMIELCGNAAYTLNKTRINILHVLITIMDDDELSHQPFLLK
jgi:hypothetical protein